MMAVAVQKHPKGLTFSTLALKHSVTAKYCFVLLLLVIQINADSPKAKSFYCVNGLLQELSPHVVFFGYFIPV